jgi:hypothetical protein
MVHEPHKRKRIAIVKKLILLVATISIFVLATVFTGARIQAQSPAVVPVYYADGKPVPNAHMVIGQISVPAGGGPGVGPVTEEFPVTLAGTAAFTSADSYKCFAAKPFGAGLLNGGLFRIIDGSHFAFRSSRFGPAWQQDFFCIGN